MSCLCCCCKPTPSTPPRSTYCLPADVARIGQLDDPMLITRVRSLCPRRFQEIADALLATELGIDATMLHGKAYRISYDQQTVTRRSLIRQPQPMAPESEAKISQALLLHLKEIREFLLLEKSLHTNRIFKKSGSVPRQRRLKSDILHKRRQLNLNSGFYSPHDCATVLQELLSDMPEPLMTDSFYPAYDNLANILHDDISKFVTSLGLLIQMLPDENRDILETVIAVMQGVAAHSRTNMMPAKDLAIIMAPILLTPRELPPEAYFYVSKKMAAILEFMINNTADLFKPPPALCAKLRAFVETASITECNSQ